VGLAGRAAYILLTAATEARRSELIALRWADLDLDKGSVWIAPGIVLGPPPAGSVTATLRPP